MANEAVSPSASKPNDSPISNSPSASHNENSDKKQVPVVPNKVNTTNSNAAEHNSSVLNSTPTSSPTTKAPPSPTPAPAPTYGIGKWNVTDDKGHICIMLTGEIALMLVNQTVSSNNFVRDENV